MSEQKYPGAEWIQAHAWGKNISPLGSNVADLLGDVFGGIYHLEKRLLEKVDWANTIWIEVRIIGELSTFDNPRLTWLVVLAHDRMLRMSIDGHCNGQLRLMFHQRARTGDVSRRMPTIEDHLASIRKFHPAPETAVQHA